MFNIKLYVELYEGQYKLIYIDKDNVERGKRDVSFPFVVMECYRSADSSLSHCSSGSFEVVSDNEQSFTVVNFEDTSIHKNWEIPTSESSTDDDTDGSQVDDKLENVHQSPSALLLDMERETKMHDDIEPNICSKLVTSSNENDEQMLVMKTSNVELNDSDEQPIAENILSSASPPRHNVNPWLDENEGISKSVILGCEHLSQAEIQSLQAKNRAYIKKVKKLSELLDNEKKVSNELLEKLMSKTEESVLLLETVKKVRMDLQNVKQDAQKKIRSIKKDCNEKDALIISLRKINERCVNELKIGKGEQGMPQSTRYDQFRDPHRETSQSNYHITKEPGVRDIDRKCDIEIVRPSSHDKPPTSHHHRGESKEKERHKRRHHNDRSGRHYSPRKQDSPQKPTNIEDSDKQLVSCPVCNRQMPSNLSEREMTIHVEDCLKRETSKKTMYNK